VWWFSRPLALFSAIGTQHLLHCRSPSSFHLVPVCRQLQRAYYLDFARARAPRGVPSGFVQRTGCSACGLGYPHQVWWAPPMYIGSSCLGPVGFAGLLIKCLHFTAMSWAFAQFRPNAALRGHLCAVLGILTRGVVRPGYNRIFSFFIGIPDVTYPKAAATAIKKRVLQKKTVFSMTSCINFSEWPAASRSPPLCELRASRAAVPPLSAP
jgi:hypothetical protein